VLEHWDTIYANRFRYRIIQFLGKGGNGAVYHVIREGKVAGNDDDSAYGTGGNYALKLAHEELADERVQRFRKEQKFLEGADHPAILPYHDEGNFSGSPFMVVEYLPDTLRQTILSPRVSMAEKLNYSTQLVSALNHIHNLDQPVIHRDIKPENILVRQNTCFLADFGLVKREGSDDDSEDESTLKQSNETALVYKYPTPDLVEYETGGKLTTKSDIFQLGIVLTELFTGRNQNPIKNVQTRQKLDPVKVGNINNIPGGGCKWSN